MREVRARFITGTPAWIVATALLAWTSRAAAQPLAEATGRIEGRVVEARTGTPLVAALLQVVSTRQRALSDDQGRFAIDDVPAGPQTLVVSAVGFGLVRQDVTVVAHQTNEVTIPVAEGASAYVEEVVVAADPSREAAQVGASQAVLSSRELLTLSGVIAGDPLRAVHVLPGVATGDDYRADFAVRGLGPAHIGLAIDGVDSPFLLHSVRAITASTAGFHTRGAGLRSRM